MKEQIKALIEKYEGKESELRFELRNLYPGSSDYAYFNGRMQTYISVYEKLKELIKEDEG